VPESADIWASKLLNNGQEQVIKFTAPSEPGDSPCVWPQHPHAGCGVVMNRRQRQAAWEQARKRAVALGNAGDTAAVPELISLCSHDGPTVRRAAASAIGKLATDQRARQAVPMLCQLIYDPKPQVGQYAALALGKIADQTALARPP
jgi:hypothetical protein